MFFDVYKKLCEEHNVTCSRAALDMGINKGTVSVWKKKGTSPQAAQLQKIAEYFGVSADYLLSMDKKENPIAESNGEIVARECADLTDVEREDILKYIAYLKSKRESV